MKGVGYERFSLCCFSSAFAAPQAAAVVNSVPEPKPSVPQRHLDRLSATEMIKSQGLGDQNEPAKQLESVSIM